jgi:hypothetical protein
MIGTAILIVVVVIVGKLAKGFENYMKILRVTLHDRAS